jgi:deazaflavin-dependent oxidoreductase (nitroreductase family)
VGRDRSPALKGTALGRVLRAWNPAMKRLLASPLHWPWSRWFLIVEWTGRKTGDRHSTPVSYVVQGEEIWLTTGDAWWRNLTENPRVRINIRGRWQRAVATPVADEAEAIRLHTEMFRARPAFARLAGLPSPPSTDDVATAVRSGRTLVRVVVADAAGTDAEGATAGGAPPS